MRLNRTFVLSFILICAGVARVYEQPVATQSSGAFGELRGQVKDLCGKVAIPDATVTLENESGALFRTLTDGEGRYVFRGLSITNTPWVLGVGPLPPYAPTQRDNIYITEGPSVEHNLRLVPDLTLEDRLTVTAPADANIRFRKYSVFGTVIGPDGSGLSGAIVTLRNASPGRSIQASGPCETDEFGRYHVYEWLASELPLWVLTVETPDFAAYVQSDMALEPDTPKAVTIRLRPE